MDPLDTKTGLWDLFIIIAIYIFQIQISLLLGFGPNFWYQLLASNTYIVTYVAFVIIFIVDVVINFHKGYYAFGRGKVIDDPELIIKHYLKIYFAMDVICKYFFIFLAIGILIIPLIHSDYFLNFLQLVPAVLLYFKKFKNQN